MSASLLINLLFISLKACQNINIQAVGFTGVTFHVRSVRQNAHKQLFELTFG